jgi:hypothetical protein
VLLLVLLVVALLCCGWCVLYPQLVFWGVGKCTVDTVGTVDTVNVA